VRRLTAVALLLLLSCTEQPAAAPEKGDSPVPAPTEEPTPPPRATIRLVSSPDPSLASFREGVRFALEEVVAQGELDLRLLDAPSVATAVRLDPAAVIVLGDAASVAEARPSIEEARLPVVLMGGDLYSSRQLFRYAFQTSIPYRWQAEVAAKYLVSDRGYDALANVIDTGLDPRIHDAVNEAIAGEGGIVSVVSEIGESSPALDAEAAADAAVSAGADAVLFLGGTAKATQLAHALAQHQDPPQLALASEALDVSWLSVPNRDPAAGTVAPYSYTWSGWADMLPRVSEFRRGFSDFSMHYPASLEQEGYDAMRALADALIRTGGEGGDRLVLELETFREETYSSVPVRLGPDDHVLAEQSHLGLFAIEEPVDGALPPPEASSLLPWRPILRTFTTDGEKMNFLDRDKRIFFPFWRPKRPTPKYWRAEFGIVSRSSDPLH
jgi:ABC-type branched-subunit amino acid transport system substrate-binding protein